MLTVTPISSIGFLKSRCILLREQGIYYVRIFSNSQHYAGKLNLNVAVYAGKNNSSVCLYSFTRECIFLERAKIMTKLLCDFVYEIFIAIFVFYYINFFWHSNLASDKLRIVSNFFGCITGLGYFSFLNSVLQTIASDVL